MTDQQQDELGFLAGKILANQGVTRPLPNLEAFASDVVELASGIDKVISQTLQQLRQEIEGIRTYTIRPIEGLSNIEYLQKQQVIQVIDKHLNEQLVQNKD